MANSGDTSVTCRYCGDEFDGPTVAIALKSLGKHASEGYE